MREVLHNIWNGLATAGPLDQLNLVLGVVGVWLMIRRSLWAFPVGLAAVSVQGVLFYQAHFPADAALQVFYFATLAWGWHRWLRDRDTKPELPVTKLSAAGWAVMLASAIIVTVAWASAIGPWMHAAMPWRDAFIAAFSVAAQVLQVRRNIENWPLWVLVNVVAVISYWSAELAYTSFLYAIYLGLALVGWRQWRRAMKVAPVNPPSADEGVRP
ncbi:MAG: nicotinamide mononucleotide transporter [Verrucomicrobia bacterium]|nr:nicotinamide mononucleotide transporter [Verrucomicrobiota bacterium]